ncbi:hypothetical protein NARC_10264 [Candidatus Nitrosocosmicus arcticus]|uniref:Uncharacterized protein n=1 Tax=Candidatus Nitrosocosmicus arcticus TaxID=2035267 RepID=A0A557SZ34_9ARCH|nr:hypothetical protein NARC_10264 [Candidatus Nitrosocosmicus arcticus]
MSIISVVNLFTNYSLKVKYFLDVEKRKGRNSNHRFYPFYAK